MPNLASRLLQMATLTSTLIITMSVGAYESAYEKTSVGSIEVRELPAGRWIMTKMEGGYFERSDGLFMRLFDYINNNGIAMTVPVHGGLTRAEMRFYLDEDVLVAPTETDIVQIVDEPARRVASMGGRGAYTEANLSEAKQQLISWLERQPE